MPVTDGISSVRTVTGFAKRNSTVTVECAGMCTAPRPSFHAAQSPATEPATESGRSGADQSPSGAEKATTATSRQSRHGSDVSAPCGKRTFTRRPPSTSVRLADKWRIAFSGLIHGPPAIAHPGHTCIVNFSPSLRHSLPKCPTRPSHSGLRHFTCLGTPGHAPCTLFPLKSFTPEIPAAFTASRSAVMPSAEMLPPKKKKYVSGRFDVGGTANSVSGTPLANADAKNNTGKESNNTAGFTFISELLHENQCAHYTKIREGRALSRPWHVRQTDSDDTPDYRSPDATL